MSSTEPRGVVTPEAVVLEFETAGVGSRVLPALLDLFIQGVILWAVMMVVSLFAAVGANTVAVILMLASMFAVLFGYPALMETFWNGRTLGKAVGGLRVVTREGGPIRFRHAAIRSMARLFELILLLGAPAVISTMLTRDNQRLGDLVAGTLVLRERTADPPAVPVAFRPPYGYESYATSLDVGGLSEQQYGVVRAFLLRAAQLAPQARSVLAVRLANPVALRINHTPPAMMNPELFLASVVAAWQMRQVRASAPPPPPPLSR